MSECWDQMGVGMKVEVACGAEGVTKDAYWVATVIGIAGEHPLTDCCFGRVVVAALPWRPLLEQSRDKSGKSF